MESQKNKPIKRIRITNKLMDLLVLKLFRSEQINRDRYLKNKMNGEWEMEVPPLVIDLNNRLNISIKDIHRYIRKQEESMNSFSTVIGYPYISLVSNNSENDLQIFINSFSYDSDGGISCNDIRAYSRYFIMHYDKKKKYTFYNR